ncbi:MAG: hypothetical protein LBK53_06610 [Heliobacteriaceae bacterium]|nr:hypothetical protein [Heliobacteriaceae bacterium]
MANRTICSISLQHLSICTGKKTLQKLYIFIGGQMLKQVQHDGTVVQRDVFIFNVDTA